jgi:hypothetical protein
MIVNFSNEPVEKAKYSIFLAGPTYRDADFSQSWRKEAVEMLQKTVFGQDPGTAVYIPEYPVGVEFDSSCIETQTFWEWEALGRATVIMFWIPRNTRLPGYTTNVEFGRYVALKPESVVLGYPEDASKMRYLTIMYRHMVHREPVHTLQQTIHEALNVFDELRRR